MNKEENRTKFWKTATFVSITTAISIISFLLPYLIKNERSNSSVLMPNESIDYESETIGLSLTLPIRLYFYEDYIMTAETVDSCLYRFRKYEQERRDSSLIDVYLFSKLDNTYGIEELTISLTSPGLDVLWTAKPKFGNSYPTAMIIDQLYLNQRDFITYSSDLDYASRLFEKEIQLALMFCSLAFE